MYAYNPRKKAAEHLESSLVGADRWDILNGILAELALKEGEGPKQHWMIVGARGMGKSHLLTLLHHKVCGDEQLSRLWIPVLFPEEIRMAGDLARFLERALAEIQRDLERSKDPVAPALKEKIARIRSIRHDERVDYLFSVIAWVRRETGRHILLIAENLQQLLGKKISLLDQKKLRAFLQSEDALLLIGSATTIFDALHDHSHPFYHFFHIRRLEELSFEDVKTLVANLLSGYGKEDRTRIMMENEARLRVLYSFTGGNPRMAVFLSDILKTDVNEEMINIMDRILDELTPYFEAIINDTPEYLQDIINTLAAYEPAQSPKEIAEHLEMEQGTVRNYLKQAKDNGYVRVAFSRGKSNYYCLNEYLYRTWFQMRDSSHREEMRWLMELMLLLYSREQIMAENHRIGQGDAEAGNRYCELVKQTCEFMISNPSFCAVIDMCAQQTGEKKRARKRAKDLDERLNQIMSDAERRIASINKNLSSRERAESATHILIDAMVRVNNSALQSLFAYAFGISAYFKTTFDISKALSDYSDHIVTLFNNNSSDIINDIKAIDSSENNLLILAIAANDNDLSLNMLTNTINYIYEPLVDLSLHLLIVKIIYHIKSCNYDDMSNCYELLHNICKKLNINTFESILFVAVMTSLSEGLISGESATKLIEYATAKSKEFFVISLAWACIREPESEQAQKLMTDPAIANLVNALKDLMAVAVRREGKQQWAFVGED